MQQQFAGCGIDKPCQPDDEMGHAFTRCEEPYVQHALKCDLPPVDYVSSLHWPMAIVLCIAIIATAFCTMSWIERGSNKR